MCIRVELLHVMGLNFRERKKMKDSTKAVCLTSILVGARLLPHAVNFTPVGALALLAGSCFANPVAAIFTTLFALGLSDCFLGFHSTILFVYGSVLLSVFLGRGLARKIERKFSVLPVLGASLFSSIGFFLLTNFGVWLCSGLYEHSFSGFGRAYLCAIPFYRGIGSNQIGVFLGATVLGDLFYTFVLFGLYYGVFLRRAMFQFFCPRAPSIRFLRAFWRLIDQD